MNGTAQALRMVSFAVVLGALGCSTLHESDTAKLQGTWKGPEIGREAEGECSLVVTGTNVEFRGGNPDVWYKGTFSLRQDSNPRVLVASISECCEPRYNGKTCFGVYRIEGGTLYLTVNEPGSPEPPSGFDAPDTRQFVLKKQ